MGIGPIVRAVLAMARSLGMVVTAEGVETLEQARTLKAMACDYLQGFYFSPPVRAESLLGLLSQQWSLDEPSPPVSGANARNVQASLRRVTEADAVPRQPGMQPRIS